LAIKGRASGVSAELRNAPLQALGCIGTERPALPQERDQ